MEPANLREYELIREEMLHLKACITTYVGYVLGGAGLAIVGLSAVAREESKLIPVGYAALLLGLLIALVLHTIVYKFYSHNRYAGYAKLLSLETHTVTHDNGVFVAWEQCIGELREHSGIVGHVLKAVGPDVANTDAELGGIEEQIARHQEEDRRLLRGLRGLLMVVGASVGLANGRSWGFPPNVMVVFFVIAVSFVLAGVVPLTHRLGHMDAGALAIYAILGAQALLWLHFFARLDKLMHGSASVEASCWRLLPFRVEYLKQVGVRPSYMLGRAATRPLQPPTLRLFARAIVTPLVTLIVCGMCVWVLYLGVLVLVR